MVMVHVPRIIRAARYFPNHLDRRQQEALLAQVRGVVADGPCCINHRTSAEYPYP